jgi:hypothetical protein
VGEQQSFSQFWVDTDVTIGKKDGGGWARISECGKYRYSLGRRWDDCSRPATAGTTFIMLNPSTADDAVDDPTIRRCIGFAKRIGDSSLLVVNLFAFRATDPTALACAVDPVGPENDKVIRRACMPEVSKVIIAAWGLFGQQHTKRVNEVLSIVTDDCHRQLCCLGTTASGAPRHPLYLPADAPLGTWP